MLWKNINISEILFGKYLVNIALILLIIALHCYMHYLFMYLLIYSLIFRSVFSWSIFYLIFKVFSILHQVLVNIWPCYSLNKSDFIVRTVDKSVLCAMCSKAPAFLFSWRCMMSQCDLKADVWCGCYIFKALLYES